MNKKIIKLSLFFVVFLGIFQAGFSYGEDEQCGIQPIQGEGNSHLKLSIITPFNDVISNVGIKFTTKREDVQTRKISLAYQDIPGNYNCGGTKDMYCTVGGQYKTRVELYVPNLGSGVKQTDRTENLFYCETTKDLYNKVKIPSSWTGDNLLVYCNDGVEAGYSDIFEMNFEVLSNVVNSYKVCIIKNQDLTANNTVIHGIEYGIPNLNLNPLSFGAIYLGKQGWINPNTIKESDYLDYDGYGGGSSIDYVAYNAAVEANRVNNEAVLANLLYPLRPFQPKVFNPETQEGSLVNGLTYVSTISNVDDIYKLKYVDKLNREYYVTYNKYTYEFSIAKTSLNLNTPLNSFYNISDQPKKVGSVSPKVDIDTSRSIFVKTKDNGEKILGYDMSGIENSLDTRFPIYYINNFNFNQKNSCITYLGKYGAIVPTTTVGQNDKVRCLTDGEIEINTVGWGDSARTEPFNIYKNLIFGYE